METTGMAWRALIVSAALLTAPAAFAADGLTPVSVAYVPATSFLPAFVAKDAGIFARHGLDVTLTSIALMPNVPPALLSGSMQIGPATGPGFLQAAEAGLELVAISGAARQSADHCTTSLVAAADAGIHEVADLKGRRIGIPGLLSVSDLLFRVWLKQHGMNPAQMVFVEVSLAQERDLLHSRQIDAALAVEPVRARVLDGGQATLIANYPVEVRADLLYSFWISTRAWATAHPGEVRAFRASLDEAIGLIGEHGSADVELKYLKINSTVRPILTTVIRPDDLRFYQKVLKELGMSSDTTDPGPLIVH